VITVHCLGARTTSAIRDIEQKLHDAKLKNDVATLDWRTRRRVLPPCGGTWQRQSKCWWLASV